MKSIASVDFVAEPERLALGENCGTLETFGQLHNKGHPVSDSHMTTERHFKISQTAFRMHVAQSTDSIDDEAVIQNGGLEPLLSGPCTTPQMMLGQQLATNLQVMLMTWHRKSPRSN